MWPGTGFRTLMLNHLTEQSVYYPFTIRLKRIIKAFKRFSHLFNVFNKTFKRLTYPFKKNFIRLTIIRFYTMIIVNNLCNFLDLYTSMSVMFVCFLTGEIQTFIIIIMFIECLPTDWEVLTW